VPIFDYQCEDCQVVEEFIESYDEASKPHICPVCSKTMDRQFPNKTNFRLSYNNHSDQCDWSGNTSQYWNEFNKARAEGRDVRPSDEK